MMKPIRLLLIRDEHTPADFLPLDLLPFGARVVTEHADSALLVEQALQWLEPDLVVAEYELPALPRLQALRLVRRLRPSVPVIVVADARDEARELEALHHGALDCVAKADRTRLLAAMRHALNEVHERRARLEAERALQDSELRFRLFMEHMPGAVYMKDLDGRYTYVNRVAQRVIGRPAAQIVGQTPHQLFPPDVADVLVANDERALKVRQPVEAIEEADTPNGRRVFLSTKFPVIGADGLPMMVGGFSVDITNLRSS